MKESLFSNKNNLEALAGELKQPGSFIPRSNLIHEMIDAAFILSGPVERDDKYRVRLERTIGRLNQLEIVEPIILSGEPTPDDLKRYQMFFEEGVPDRFVSGLTHQRGAAFKHLRALEAIVSQDISLALVCEDDVLFHEDFRAVVSNLVPKIPRDADIVYLGYSNPIRQFEESLTEPVNGIWKGAFWCLHCSLITQQGALKILNALPMLDQIDYFYGRLAAEGSINAYAPKYLHEELERSGRCAYTARGFCYQEKDSV